MLYAGRDRSFSMRRCCLRICPSMAVPGGGAGDNDGEGRSCCGGAPARRACSLTAGADHAVSEEVSWAQSVAVISAQQNPASSRATAAATTDFTFLRAARAWKRADSRTCALHARATVAALTPAWRALMVMPIAGWCW